MSISAYDPKATWGWRGFGISIVEYLCRKRVDSAPNRMAANLATFG
jgi:hypothetical protein